MLNRVKSGNRNEQQNRKTKVFLAQKLKNQSKNSLNRKTENPNAPILIEEWLQATLHSTPRRSGENDYMEFWGRKKKHSNGLRSIVSRKLYFGFLSSISKFSLK